MDLSRCLFARLSIPSLMYRNKPAAVKIFAARNRSRRDVRRTVLAMAALEQIEAEAGFVGIRTAAPWPTIAPPRTSNPSETSVPR
jgi:hypothetical protein